jgi:hypothetical protein
VSRWRGERKNSDLVVASWPASHLDISGARPAPEHLAMHGMPHCSAGYAAARAGDRDRANDLLTVAEATVRWLVDNPDRARALTANIVSHRVSAAYLLGDAGTALAHARNLPLAAIPTTERRARLLVDVAMSYAQWDKPDRAYATLLAAERTAPGEGSHRNAVRPPDHRPHGRTAPSGHARTPRAGHPNPRSRMIR